MFARTGSSGYTKEHKERCWPAEYWRAFLGKMGWKTSLSTNEARVGTFYTPGELNFVAVHVDSKNIRMRLGACFQVPLAKNIRFPMENGLFVYRY